MKTILLAIIVSVALISPVFGSEAVTPLTIIGKLQNATALQVEAYSDELNGTEVEWTSTVQDVRAQLGVENVYAVKLSTGEKQFSLNAVYFHVNKPDALAFSKGMVVRYKGNITGINNLFGINITVRATDVNIIK